MNPFDNFEEIVRDFYEPLFRFAMSLARAEPDAQDLTQQTFYIWATKGHQLRDPSKVKTWLFTTLHRAFLELRRKGERFTEQDLEKAAEGLPEIAPIHVDPLEAAEAVAALGKVDEVYQAALALFYLKSCSYADISEILKIPVGTVKSRIARGIRQLRKIVGRMSVPATHLQGKTSLDEKPSRRLAWNVVQRPDPDHIDWNPGSAVPVPL